MSLPKDEPILADSPKENNNSFMLALSWGAFEGLTDGVRAPIIPRCEECSFWSGFQHQGMKWGPCSNPLMLNEGFAPVDGLGEADTMGCDPCVYTGAQFGCVNHSLLSANAGKSQPATGTPEERQKQTEETTWQQ